MKNYETSINLIEKEKRKKNIKVNIVNICFKFNEFFSSIL